MFSSASQMKVYVAIGSTDMRKSINGLSLLVADQFDLDLFSGSLFAFCNRKRDIVKILYCRQRFLRLDEALGKGYFPMARIGARGDGGQPIGTRLVVERSGFEPGA